MTITPQQYIKTRPADLAATRREQLLSELDRCNRDLAQITAAPGDGRTPAYLPAMGELDWRIERELIEEEIATLGKPDPPSGAGDLPRGKRGCFRTPEDRC